jgi:hypothetical protein
VSVKDIIEKFGVKPTRSRRCNGECCCTLATGSNPGKAQQYDDPESEELPVYNYRYNLRAMGR